MIGSMSAEAKKHTCIKYKRNAFAGMEEYNRSGGTSVIPLKLYRRAIVRVVGEVEEDWRGRDVLRNRAGSDALVEGRTFDAIR